MLLSTRLDGARCADCVLGFTVLGDLDLSQVEDIESVRFRGPCCVGADTLVKSRGRIPASFLRSCGFQPWEVAASRMYDLDLPPARLAEIQHDSYRLRTEGPRYVGGVFLSYQRDDADFVERVSGKLQEAGVPVWLDELPAYLYANDLPPAMHLDAPSHDVRLGEAREDCVALVVTSEQSVKSWWISANLENALAQNVNRRRQAVVALALDKAWEGMRDHPFGALSTKLVLGFSQWRDDEAFDWAFRKLVKNLEVFLPGTSRGDVSVEDA